MLVRRCFARAKQRIDVDVISGTGQITTAIIGAYVVTQGGRRAIDVGA